MQTLHTVAFLFARIADIIDVLAAPNNDPRIKNKQSSAHSAVFEVVELVLSLVQYSHQSDPLARKSFFSLERAEECLVKVIELAEQHHFYHRSSQQRLNLKFEYSYI
jgi:hypothetical protein